MGLRLLLAVCLLLNGCAIPVLVTAGISAVSVGVNEATGKTVTDHVVSGVNGQDCRVARVVDGRDMCQDAVVESAPAKAVVAKKSTSNIADDYELVLAQRKGAQNGNGR